MTQAENVKTNFVIEEKRFRSGVRYYCVYSKGKLLMLTRSVKVIRKILDGHR